MGYVGSIQRYPYHGVFSKETSDVSVPLTERKLELVPVFETECDIQEVSKANNPLLIGTFAIFFPFDVSGSIPVFRGMHFSSEMCGQTISGEVVNVVPSQLNGVVAYVKDYEAE